MKLFSFIFIKNEKTKVYLSTRRGTWVLHRVGPNGWPSDMLLTSEVYGIATKYCPSLVNWLVERDMNQKFNHDMYGLKPNHRPLG
jgi:dimethylaniline monooxygenase (N-oxide forming)